MLLPFFYHTVSDEDLPHCKHLFPVKTVREFEADLEFLLKKYEPIDLEELPIRHRLKKPKFLLTFDDGMREVGEIVAPILLKKGIPAIFFACREFAEGNAIFHKHLASFHYEKGNITSNDFKASDDFYFGAKERGEDNSEQSHRMPQRHSMTDENPMTASELYLKTEELKSLADKGFLIGSHSLDHPHFSKISEAEGHRQITESMQWVVKNFNPTIRTFAFPFEDYFLKKSFFENLTENDFSPEIIFGTSEGKKDQFSIQRIDAERNGWHIERIIKNYRQKKLMRKLLGKDRIKR